MATQPARRFEPIAPPRDVARGFQPTSSTGRGFVPEGGHEAAAPEKPPTTLAEIEALRNEAYDRGVAEGRAALPWQEAAALEQTLVALEQTARHLAGLRRGYLVENRKAVIELACAIAEQLAGAPAVRDDVLDTLLERALEAAALDDAPIAVRVAPADLAVLERARAAGGDLALCFAADPQLLPGEVRIATRTGDVRASLAIAIERIRDALGEALATPEPTAGEASS